MAPWEQHERTFISNITSEAYSNEHLEAYIRGVLMPQGYHINYRMGSKHNRAPGIAYAAGKGAVGKMKIFMNLTLVTENLQIYPQVLVLLFKLLK